MIKTALILLLLFASSLEAKYYACSNGQKITPETSANGTITFQFEIQGIVKTYLDCTSIGDYDLPDEELVSSNVINYFCPSVSFSRELLENKITLQLQSGKYLISRKNVYPKNKKSGIKAKIFWRLGEDIIDDKATASECEWTSI